MHVREMVRYAQIAESHGFESAWIAESRLARDALTPMTAIATVTSRIKVGAGVINTWTRNAALIAQTFATMDELSDGRVLLGLGAWWDPLAWKVGIERTEPLRCMREYVQVIRSLFRMEEVTFEGKFVKMRGVRLDVLHGAGEKPRNIPIYIGATGWKMMELAGEIGDGVLLNYLVSPQYNDTALHHIKIGAAKAGRKLEDIDRPQLIACSMHPDGDKAVKLAKKHVTMTLGQQPHIMKASGVSEDLIQEVQRVMGGWPAKPGGIEKATEIVPDDVVRMITASGTVSDVINKVKEYMAHGCTSPLLLPLSGDPEYLIKSIAEA
ncbi:MAG: LLM class flavin-dependent oxidoreductase [Candidatus Caldarchaeum sp.]|nr:LLM class flavin-dependent oxidoreductase [Candidatus Caldarchaeum sp.]MDW8062978.1 LLM class flavin-dependent oxidoreductase [Candidatus Caldarchaeum sp.]MDW8434938.1 LLM class flavin-dependent oxidoreductase [Candidatus Caldarchaeum sp.]